MITKIKSGKNEVGALFICTDSIYISMKSAHQYMNKHKSLKLEQVIENLFDSLKDADIYVVDFN